MAAAGSETATASRVSIPWPMVAHMVDSGLLNLPCRPCDRQTSCPVPADVGFGQREQPLEVAHDVAANRNDMAVATRRRGIRARIVRGRTASAPPARFQPI